MQKTHNDHFQSNLELIPHPLCEVLFIFRNSSFLVLHSSSSSRLALATFSRASLLYRLSARNLGGWLCYVFCHLPSTRLSARNLGGWLCYVFCQNFFAPPARRFEVHNDTFQGCLDGGPVTFSVKNFSRLRRGDFRYTTILFKAFKVHFHDLKFFAPPARRF